MARPLKEGLDYFPMDVHNGDPLRLMMAEFGAAGLGVVVALWQRIYGGHGYYCDWDPEVALLFGREHGVEPKLLDKMLAAAVRRGLFDREKLERDGVLTGEDIQQRYFKAVCRREPNGREYRHLLPGVQPLWREKGEAETGKPARETRLLQPQAPQTKQKETTQNKRRNSARALPQEVTAFWKDNGFGQLGQYVEAEMTGALAQGMEPGLLVAAMAEAVKNNARRWSYVDGILNRCRREKITTAAGFANRGNSRMKDAFGGTGRPPAQRILGREEAYAPHFGRVRK